VEVNEGVELWRGWFLDVELEILGVVKEWNRCYMGVRSLSSRLYSSLHLSDFVFAGPRV